MSLIIDTFTTYLPPKRKTTPSGWIALNAVCCTHNGEKPDTRSRGGAYITDDSVTWHCFNCGFKASWHPGRALSTKFKNLLQWLSVPDDLISKCAFESLRLKDEDSPEHKHELTPKFFDRSLPTGAGPIKDWLLDPPPQLEPIIAYMAGRKYNIDDYPWYWSDDPKWNERLIIPFYYQSRLVGYTARLCRDRKTAKYLSEQQPGFVFNLDNQSSNRKFVLVTEGPMDAICVDGVSVMSNEVSAQQRFLISRLQKEVVVVPDRDRAGVKLVEQALDWGWSVSLPDWEPGIKDINDAVRHYGKLYTVWSIVNSKETMPLKIQLKLKSWLR